MRKIFTIAILALSINAFAQIPTNGLVAWYPFNGNANDASGNGNNGTVYGATLTADRFGNLNSAYSLDGINNYIELQGISIVGDFSFSGWIYLRSYNLSCAFFNLGNAGDTDGVNLNFTNLNTPSLHAQIWDGTTYTNANLFCSTTTIPLNSWTNITITLSGSNFSFYINGSLVNVITSSNIPGNINRLLQYIGKPTHNGNENTNGIFDDIRFYNRALNQSEITAIYNETPSACTQTITVTDTLIINANILGFNPVTYQNTIRIYPNPTNDHITIDNGNIANLTGYQIKITNSLSQQVFQSAINQQQFYVDLSTWTGNGIYFVHIIDGQGNTIDIKKIVLQ